MQRIPLFTVVGCRATAEQRVFAVARMAVVLLDGRTQTLGVDTASLGQRFKGVAFLQVAGAYEGFDRQWERAGNPQAITALEGMAADQPGGHLFTRRRSDHGTDIVIVTAGFVDEALAVRQYTDNAWPCHVR